MLTAENRRIIAWSVIFSLLFWHWPFDGKVVYPFKLLATWIHEGSHALVMIATGAGFSHMEIFPDTAGLAFQTHGVNSSGQALISSAGYMGTPLFGCYLLMQSRTKESARRAAVVVAITMGLSALLAIDNHFGKVATAIGGAFFLVIAIPRSKTTASFFLTLVGVQCCINALLDIRVLFRSHMVVNGLEIIKSDAHLMADATFGTPKLWAGVWMVWSLTCLFFALRYLSKITPDTTPVSDADRSGEPSIQPQITRRAPPKNHE